MLLYTKKMLPYNIINILCLLIANILFLFAFVFLFADSSYAAGYYQWLKNIDYISSVFIVIGVVMGSILLIPHYLLYPPKNKKLLHIIFSIIEIYIVILAFFNYISFYTGIIHTLFIISMVLMLVAQIALMIGNVVADKTTLYDGYDKEYLAQARVYNKANKTIKKVDIQKLNKDCIVVSKKPVLCALLSIICYIGLFVTFVFCILKLNLSINQKVICIFVSAFLMLILLLLACFLILQGKSTLKSLHANKWLLIVLLIINALIFCGIFVILFFVNQLPISVYLLLPYPVLVVLINYLLLSVGYTNITICNKILT